jgi:hypothetical protein
LLKELDERGFYLFGERRIKKITFSNGSKDDWQIAIIVIRKKDNSEIIYKNNVQ